MSYDNPSQFLKPSENLTAFLQELTQLSQRFGVSITGCGCCASPQLNEGAIDTTRLYFQSPWDGSLQYGTEADRTESSDLYRFTYEDELAEEKEKAG